MLKDIVAVEPLNAHRLRLYFEDGVNGVVDIATLVTFQGIFAPLADPAYFHLAQVDSDLGTVAWPNGADLDPDVLYALISGIPLPDFAGEGANSQHWAD
jgi:hypothetical protein